MRKGIFLEYLGEIGPELIPQNVAANEFNPSIAEFKQAFPRGFVVSVQIEQEIYEAPEDKQTFLTGMLQRATGVSIPGRKIVGLVLTPK